MTDEITSKDLENLAAAAEKVVKVLDSDSEVRETATVWKYVQPVPLHDRLRDGDVIAEADLKAARLLVDMGFIQVCQTSAGFVASFTRRGRYMLFDEGEGY